MSTDQVPTDPSRRYLHIVANGLRQVMPGPWYHEQMRRGVRIWAYGADEETEVPVCYTHADITTWGWLLGARDEVAELAAAVTAVLDVADQWAGSDHHTDLLRATQLRDAVYLALHSEKAVEG